MTYVYPVVSRRAGGISIGINLNPNNACNWRCIYCQVPELKRGTAPKIDLLKLETELRDFLHELIHGNFMRQQVPLEVRRINDIALSGNGEPTSAKTFEQIISLIIQIKNDFPELPADLKLILITNGSLINRPYVQAGLAQMAKNQGEIWFKLDSATREGRQRINNTRMSLNQVHENLSLAASLCPTWLQTCVFQFKNEPPTEKESNAYLKFIQDFLQEGMSLKGVLLYGIARPSLQPEASQLSKVTEAWLATFGKRIEALGLAVKINS
ncbi:MAG: radical SAM protein [Nitrosomonas sp.]|nr:radical SAM protein [Nitrosomonas sp.]MDP1950133.1 radical SAM protein [Nitrosomonas sp.]